MLLFYGDVIEYYYLVYVESITVQYKQIRR